MWRIWNDVGRQAHFVEVYNSGLELGYLSNFHE